MFSLQFKLLDSVSKTSIYLKRLLRYMCVFTVLRISMCIYRKSLFILYLNRPQKCIVLFTETSDNVGKIVIHHRPLVTPRLLLRVQLSGDKELGDSHQKILTAVSMLYTLI